MLTSVNFGKSFESHDTNRLASTNKLRLNRFLKWSPSRRWANEINLHDFAHRTTWVQVPQPYRLINGGFGRRRKNIPGQMAAVGWMWCLNRLGRKSQLMENWCISAEMNQCWQREKQEGINNGAFISTFKELFTATSVNTAEVFWFLVLQPQKMNIFWFDSWVITELIQGNFYF